MGVKASRVKHQVDTDASVVLRNGADGTEGSTVTEAGVSLKELDAAYWQDGEIPHGVFEIAVNVLTLVAGGTNAYTLSFVADDTANMSDTPTTLISKPITRTGMHYFTLDSRDIPLDDPESSGLDKWLASRITIAGDTAPAINYDARITKSKGA